MKIARNINGKRPMSLRAQNALITDAKLSDKHKRQTILMSHRRQLWQQGSPQDIKKGNYFVCSRSVDATDNIDKSYFDKVLTFKDRTWADGWAKGLKSNITFKVKNGPYVLVMDNHNFAAPFIFDMLSRQVIGFNNRLMHVDRHADLGTSCTFKFADYLSLKTDEERFFYVIKNTNIANWSHPLLMSSVVADGLYLWFRVHEGRETWIKIIVQEEDKMHDVETLSEHILLEKHEELKGSQLVDIDIDFLEHMDFMLNEREKRDVLAGNVPTNISFKLSELVPFILGSKATTIALSPCYIEQNRALMYVKHLLGMLGEVQQYE